MRDRQRRLRLAIMMLAGLVLASCAAPPAPIEDKADIITSSAPSDIKPETPPTKPADVADAPALDDNALTDEEAKTREALIATIDKALKDRETASQEAQDAQDEDGPDNQSDDMIASIIWELEKTDNQTKTDSAPVPLEDLIPEGRDPSLEAAALDAAFAMLQAPEDKVAVRRFEWPIKQAGHRRIGVFVPLSGQRDIYGAQVVDGIEMALFQINDPLIDVIYFDTADKSKLATLASEAAQAQIDIAIGPLFSDYAQAIYPYLAAQDIPILSLSNNHSIARSGLWVLGLLPQQQIDTMVAESILKGHDQIAILADQSDYGRMLSSHVTDRLQNFGLEPASVMMVDGRVGADDETLIRQLKSFSAYRPLEEDELIQDVPPPYDSVILAGDANFIIKVAPLLSYYDLGPDRVRYLGTDLWASAGLIGEPSLQGAYIATIEPALRSAFSQRYDALYQARGSSSDGSFLSQLGFDALAVASNATQAATISADNQTTSLQSPVVSRLVNERGFKGYTGAFRLLANGLNNRRFSVYQVEGGTLRAATMAPKETEEYNSTASAPQS